jgi:hypothetical protein
MIKCPVCNNEIKLQNLNKHYKITLGDIVNGKFQGKNIFYYHKECLTDKNLYEKRLIAPITE